MSPRRGPRPIALVTTPLSTNSDIVDSNAAAPRSEISAIGIQPTNTPRLIGSKPTGHCVDASACAPVRSLFSRPTQRRSADFSTAPLKLARSTLAPQRSAFVKSACSNMPVERIASLSTAFRKMVARATQLNRSARVSSQPLRFARSSHADRRFAPTKFALLRFWDRRTPSADPRLDRGFHAHDSTRNVSMVPVYNRASIHFDRWRYLASD